MFLSHELTKLKMGTRALHITATTPLDLYTMGAPIEGILSDGTARPLSHHPLGAAGAFPRITTACFVSSRLATGLP